MRKFFLLLLAATAIAIGAQAAKPKDTRKTEVRKTQAFERIRLAGPVNVCYTQGKKHSVTVKAQADVIKDVITYTEGNTLIVTYNSKGNNSTSSLWNWIRGKNSDDAFVVYVTSPDIIEVSLTGSGDFIAKGKIDTDNMKLMLRGSGDMTLENIICDNISTELVGSGDIKLSHVDALKSSIYIVGSGDIGVKQQNVRHTDITLKGSGDIAVTFTNCGSATSRLYGSGDITLSGHLNTLDMASKGSGDYHTGKLTVRHNKK